MFYKEDDKFVNEDNISISSQEELYEEEESDLNYISENNPEHPDFIFDENILENIEWRMVKIGDTNIRISSNGKIQFMDISILYVTKGTIYSGTPYRYIEIEVYPKEFKKLLVHDLVWRVFNHSIDDNKWEIRHSNYTPLDENNCYLNNIEYLEVYKKEDIYRDYNYINI